MGIYSTVDLTTDEIVKAIEARVSAIDKLSRPRLVEILEALVQVRDYDDYDDPQYGYSNFWPNE